MFNISNYQKNANQSHNEHYLTLFRMAITKQSKITNADKDAEKGQLKHCW
jgi:hypothetical protein